MAQPSNIYHAINSAVSRTLGAAILLGALSPSSPVLRYLIANAPPPSTVAALSVLFTNASPTDEVDKAPAE